MYRVEDKYLMSPAEMFIIKRRLQAIMPSDSNDIDDAGYKISSIYFDDIYDTHYHDTVDGNPIRRKYRIRIYNDSLDKIKLEVKFKKYNRIKKISKMISQEYFYAFINGETVNDGEEGEDNPVTEFNLAISQNFLRPKVIVSYQRKAFVSMAGNVRITADTDVRASDRIDLFGNKDLVYDYPNDENYILEVKYDEFLPDYIAQTLGLYSMWQTSFSKYGICREIFIQ